MEPKIVYKYRDWEKPSHQRILINNQLYLSSPKDFNDPFDCRINHNFTLLSTKEEDDYITTLAIRQFPEAEKRGIDYGPVIKDFENRFKNKSEFQKYADTLLFTHQDKNYAIFSCSKRWNSILMWSHYSANHTGFCVGFWYHKMFDSHLFGKGALVKYDTNFPKIKPRPAQNDKQSIIDSFIETHTKSKEWQYEKEYRFMTTSPIELSAKNRIVHVPDDYIAEVILGMLISDNDKKKITEICHTKNIPLFQAKKVDFKFKITRELIKN